MGSLSPVHWIPLAIVAFLLFGGGGKLSGLMGDAAKGVKSFRKGMIDDADAPEECASLLAQDGTDQASH
jgi:sec-independent protein translocase protein TatA